MKTTSSQKIKIGFFTFTGLLVLVLAIFFIGNRKNLFSSTFAVYGTFKNVNGLQVGNNVRFAGINVGVVQAINIVTDSAARVDLTLNSDVRKFIKKDSKISIGSDGLMGDKLIVIAPGGITSTEIVKNGDQLTAVNPVDVDRIIAKMTKVIDNAETLTGGLSQIVAKVNSGQGSIGRLLNSDKLSKDLEGTVRQAKTTMQNVHKTTTTLNTDLKAAQSNFLLKGFFKKKKKKEQQDSIKRAEAAGTPATKQ
ncbi:MlaD family protein [Mucilaginibacter gotjawali]|uniref:Phospholipid/cholesterol/gamma-HCH transport system substrate-binding protein n=1 Tax=Mucilaginibacter gotjawali TaxID=1550579 RepID=A0A839SB68_9SPHI|nr:MlaD family protein [Mucilaginibacter gotjawali]MBB3054604.1 phospholipid/cholesterol/gamma-HCH transport system substrate-binding protein [Mucilaginibacter gotjawali]